MTCLRLRVLLLPPLLLVMLLLPALLAVGGCQNGPTSTTTAPTTTTTVPPAAEALAPVPAAFQRCTDCHESFDAFLAGSKVLNVRFDHLGHLQRGTTCDACHVVPPHPTEGQVVTPTMLSCFACHGRPDRPDASSACLSCHPLGFPVKPANHADPGWLTPAAPGIAAKHATASQEQPSGYCAMCHAEQFCSVCHASALPSAPGTTTTTK